MSPIQVLERTEKAKKIRREGNVPAIIYGESLKENLSVKIEGTNLSKLLKNNSKSSIVFLKVKNQVQPCVIKQVHKDNATGEILHVDFQAVKKNESIKVKVPIVFVGREALDHKKLILENFISEIEVYGNISKIPETIEIDVSNKDVQDKIFVKDIMLGEEFRINNPEDELIAVVNPLKQTGTDAEAVE